MIWKWWPLMVITCLIMTGADGYVSMGFIRKKRIQYSGKLKTSERILPNRILRPWELIWASKCVWLAPTPFLLIFCFAGTSEFIPSKYKFTVDTKFGINSWRHLCEQHFYYCKISQSQSLKLWGTWRIERTMLLMGRKLIAIITQGDPESRFIL